MSEDIYALNPLYNLVIYSHHFYMWWKYVTNTSLKQKTELFWDSIGNFMENTFGVVAFDSNKKIIGVCSSVSDFDNFHEINIEVNKNNRRQDIGYVAAYGFIQE
ncbi:MAG: GNAT family N-acetyltransferase, partial [Clostridiales bacterium]|nr:GNAT family N-acetyltransferase [Clostridiales bacterium]